MAQLDISYLRDALDYNPETGDLIWRLRPECHFKAPHHAKAWNAKYPGKKAGAVVGNGYLMFGMCGKMHYNHRVAFAIYYGRYSFAETDHINAVKTDNRICNLREATRDQNAANTVFKYNNLRGTKRQDGRFIAQMSVSNKNLYIGSFETEEEAHAAFCKAAERIRGEFAKLSHTRD